MTKQQIKQKAKLKAQLAEALTITGVSAATGLVFLACTYTLFVQLAEYGWGI
jgi:hypothetical protein